MTPPDLDRDVVHAKLRLSRELLDDLASAGEVTPPRLEGDRMMRHAVKRILTQLVYLAVAVNGHVAAAVLGRGPADYRESFHLAADAGVVPKDLAVRLASSTGLRNIRVHEYATIDLAKVAASVQTALDDYGEYVRSVARALGEATPPDGV